MSGYDWIGAAYRDRASTQSYGARPRIEGVEIRELPVFGDEGGDFCEIVRLDAEGSLLVLPGYRPRQISYSFMEPGTIKAWHLHRQQDDVWFIGPTERLLVGLLDTREESASYQISMRFTGGGGKARLLHIPHGVAHGVANVSPRGAHIMYFANATFESENPDEHRLPWDILGADFWEAQPG